MNKRGENILTENIIFVVLNLVFLGILVLFLFLKMNNAADMEERYAKEIALAIDGARARMEIAIEMEDALEEADGNGLSDDDIVFIDGNVVTVRLREKGGYSYSFFNDVEIGSYYFDTVKRADGTEGNKFVLRVG